MTTEFARALDEAITRRGVALTYLARRLKDSGNPVALSTLSYWRSGQRRPEHATSLDALLVLEDLLDLPTGHLSTALGPSPRPGPDRSVPFDELAGRPGGLRRLLEQLDQPAIDGLVSTGGALTVDVGADRLFHRTSNRLMLKARRDGEQRFVTYVHLEDPALAPPTVAAVAGCRVGREIYDPDSGFTVIELLLDRPLARLETTLIEFSYVGVRTDVVQCNYHVLAERRVSESMIWVRFDPDVTPRRCWSTETTDDETTSADTSLMGSSIHHAVRDFGPGHFGLHWAW